MKKKEERGYKGRGRRGKYVVNGSERDEREREGKETGKMRRKGKGDRTEKTRCAVVVFNCFRLCSCGGVRDGRRASWGESVTVSFCDQPTARVDAATHDLVVVSTSSGSSGCSCCCRCC